LAMASRKPATMLIKKEEKKTDIIQWNETLNSLIHVFSILMNVAKNLREHHDIEREMSSWSSSFFAYSHFSLRENEKKSPLLASLLNIWFERSKTNFLSLNTHSYNRERWNLIMIIIPIRYDFVLLHFSHVLFALLSLSLSLSHATIYSSKCCSCFFHNPYKDMPSVLYKYRYLGIEEKKKRDPNCYSNILSYCDQIMYIWSNCYLFD
jgi:hypothetical protein